MSFTDPIDCDVAVIGAGISGINAAYRIQTEAPAGTSYVLFEARSSIGGTWDLFRYPGIRSDSDIFTFGLPWSPWPTKDILASGSSIQEYLVRSAETAGIDKHIRYNHRVISANWLSDERVWVLNVLQDDKMHVFRIRFMIMGTGYYDYDKPLPAIIPGINNFQGEVIHPQFWPKDCNYSNKDIVIIGSGATAITLLPSLLDKAKHVTMLQRSPTYIASLPTQSGFTKFLYAILPRRLAGWVSRMAWLAWHYSIIEYCLKYPETVKKALLKETAKQLPPSVKLDPHFTPRYNPWDQRLCFCKDGDFFAALRSGRGTIVTDIIKEVTQDGIELQSGKGLKPDIIVTATGLNLRFAGGIQFSLDGGKPLDLSQKFAWKTCMLQDLPNVVFGIGYETMSWTLGADVSARLFTRLLWAMKQQHATVAVPLLERPENMEIKRMMRLSSTYLENSEKVFPKAGVGQWSPKRNYLIDLWSARWGDITTDLFLR